jgi:hypothetical protein
MVRKGILTSLLLGIVLMLTALAGPASAANQPGYYWRHHHHRHYVVVYHHHHHRRYWAHGHWRY